MGDAGVGKTAIVEALATKINNGEYEKFKGYKIFNFSFLFSLKIIQLHYYRKYLRSAAL